MKIGYFADGPWAHKAFQKIIADSDLEIVFIVVRYDSQDEILKEYAREHDIPVFAHPNINSEEFINRIKPFQADLFVSMSFNQIFKEEMINLPELKTINCHAGKLPFYRGRNILNWALINDEKEFGITVHYVDKGIDTGDIILQKTYEITDGDTYKTLLNRAYEGCAEVLYEAVLAIKENRVSPIKQKDIDECGTYFGMRIKGDEVIDWNQSSRDIFNFVRALSLPGPQATTYVRGHEVKIEQVKMIPNAHRYKNTVGQVVGKEKGSLIVKTADTTVCITKYQCDINIRVGDRFRRSAEEG